MTEKVNGMVAAGQHLTGGLNFYKVRTTLDIRATGVISDESQKRLDKLVETISTRAQPVIMSAVVAATATADDLAAIPGASSGDTVYTLSFAIEHNMAWEVQNSPYPTLAESLDGIEGFIYDIADTSDNNVVVGLVETL